MSGLPRVVLHLAVSLDGRHDWFTPDVGLYYELVGRWHEDVTLAGADTIIDRLVSAIPDAADGFTMVFSAEPFPGYQASAEWVREEVGGNWYYCSQLGLEGWRCPALLRYFDEAPRELYVLAKPA